MADYFIVDGKNLLWRMADAFKQLSVEINGKEIATGGIHGFLSTLIRMAQRYGGTTVIAWEGTRNFRYNLFPDYKKRDEPDEEKIQLMDEVKEQEFRLKGILRSMGVLQYFGVGCEGDDVMGTIAKNIESNGCDVVIYSGDSDLRQLVNENIFVVSPGYKGKAKLYNEEEVVRKHGVTPKQIADLKALAGDTSDKIPGVRGIGEKTAAKLLVSYDNLDSVLAAAKGKGYWDDAFWPVSERFKDAIADAEKDVLLFRKLTGIDTNSRLKKIPQKRSQAMLLLYFKAYKLRSLMAPTELKILMGMGTGNV